MRGERGIVPDKYNPWQIWGDTSSSQSKMGTVTRKLCNMSLGRSYLKIRREKNSSMHKRFNA